MRRRSRVTGQRLGVPHVHEPLDQLERVVELLASLQPSLDPEGHQRAGPAAQIFLGERVIGTLRESRVVDPLDPAIRAQEFGYASAVLHMTLDPQCNRLDSLKQQERA